MKQLRIFILISLTLANWSLPVNAAPLPQKVDSCADSFVQRKKFRMVPSLGDPEYKRTSEPFGKEVIIILTNGGAIYANDIYGNEITGDDFILSPDFAVGHKAKVCLQSIPQNCPRGDNRGRHYSFYDYQTKTTVVGYDSRNLCGGA